MAELRGRGAKTDHSPRRSPRIRPFRGTNSRARQPSVIEKRDGRVACHPDGR